MVQYQLRMMSVTAPTEDNISVTLQTENNMSGTV